MYEKYIKRCIDFLLSLTALIMLSPVILIVAVLVKIKLGSPVIFKQKRPGKNEKIFCMYKFRTMTDERDKNGNLLPDEKRLNSFLTKLRSTSLDELPQLINIIKGDMSIVGPRPLLIEYLPVYTEREKNWHLVSGVLTGLSQVNGWNFVPCPERLEMDVQYVENVSFILDCKIIKKTIVKTAIVRKRSEL